MFTDEEYIRRTRELIAGERTRIYRQLEECENYKPFYPHANFVLVKIIKGTFTSLDVFDAAIRKNLMIRDCSSFPFLNHQYLRFCFMKPEDNDVLLKVLFSMH